jgi:hypothetical protein
MSTPVALVDRDRINKGCQRRKAGARPFERVSKPVQVGRAEHGLKTKACQPGKGNPISKS